MCKCLCTALTRSTLLIFNVIDSLVGIFLLSYGIYVQQTITDSGLAWIYILVLSLGVCLLSIALMSLCGMSFDSVRCFLCLSSWLGLPLAIFELILLITFGAMKGKAMSFLDSHREELGLTESGLQSFKDLYVFFIWLLVALFALEIIRFQLSKHLRASIELSLEEYRVSLLEARHVEKRLSARSKRSIGEKYQAKRAGYINKYRGGSVGGSSGQGAEGEEQSYIDV